MYPEFAYSRAMQMILAGISFVTAYIYIYCIANLILQLYGEQATSRQKSVFALLVGVVFDSVWVYAVYFIGGMISFSKTVYLLVVTANPVFAFFYYFIGIKVLKLSPVRSIKLMGYIYMYFIIVKSLARVIASIFFVQQTGRYNYMLDAINRVIFLAVFLAIYAVTRYMLRRSKQVIELRDNLFISLNKEIAVHFIKATAIYLFSTSVPLLVNQRIVASVFVFVVLILCLIIIIMGDLYRAVKNRAENNLAHIGALSKEISVTYMGDTIDLTRKANENLSLISILMDKCECAEKMNIKMKLELNSDLRNFHINNIDVCKIVDCLLGNAIKFAAASKHKWVSFMVNSKANGNMLFIVNSSIATLGNDIAKHQRYSKDFSVVWKTIENYGNCIFHVTYYRHEMLAYLETRQRDSYRFLSRVFGS